MEPTLIDSPLKNSQKGLNYKKMLLFGVTIIMSLLPVIFFLSSMKNTDDDLKKIAHISLINEKISDALKRGINIPLPFQALSMSFGDIKMGYQGRAGKDLFLSLGIEFLKDPTTGEMYHYFLRPDTKEYEILAILNESTYGNYKIGEESAYTLGSSKGHMLVINSGKNKGKLVSSILKSAQNVDLRNEEKRKQIGWSAVKSCRALKAKQEDAPSGKYVIEYENTLITVYCDMKTDGGGWTLFYANNGHPHSKIKESYVSLRESLETGTQYQLSEYDNPELAGLLNAKYFTKDNAHEILIRNRTGDPTKWVKFSFSSGPILNWAVSNKVLGKSGKGCQKIPGDGTWSIVNQDEKIKYESLKYIMTHGGSSWGVSHENYWCNDFIGNSNPHLGFYSAGDKNDGGRARGTDGVGGAWGGENEYRYFIR